jgi:hypothetical protein
VLEDGFLLALAACGYSCSVVVTVDANVEHLVLCRSPSRSTVIEAQLPDWRKKCDRRDSDVLHSWSVLLTSNFVINTCWISSCQNGGS